MKKPKDSTLQYKFFCDLRDIFEERSGRLRPVDQRHERVAGDEGAVLDFQRHRETPEITVQVVAAPEPIEIHPARWRKFLKSARPNDQHWIEGVVFGVLGMFGEMDVNLEGVAHNPSFCEGRKAARELFSKKKRRR